MPAAKDEHRGPEFIAPLATFLATDEAARINGRYFYSSGGDICIYGHPFKLPGESHILLRKNGKWTLDELEQTLIPMIGK